ncbi:hypothetical protein NPIL_173261 [Nephila pilipes]|uniref:Uncharacterized protein n=1 Tax=Nephila pilipes TaxID=299642 RepID=A0A8X6ULD7_NEPPI|nr:hypothetical protein NPIL_173261 [Nephila pilipes]
MRCSFTRSTHHHKKTHQVLSNVVYNILAAKNVSLASSFAYALNAGYAFMPSVEDLLVESLKKSPVLNVLACHEHESAPVPNGILVQKGIQEFVDKVQQQCWLEAQYSVRCTSLRRTHLPRGDLRLFPCHFLKPFMTGCQLIWKPFPL